jgi:hypothetical protein
MVLFPSTIVLNKEIKMSMTVTQLKAYLEELEADGHGNQEVLYSYNYGDYWRTSVAAKVDTIGICKVKYSEYHQMDKVVEPEEVFGAVIAMEGREVVLIS